MLDLTFFSKEYFFLPLSFTCYLAIYLCVISSCSVPYYQELANDHKPQKEHQYLKGGCQKDEPGFS